eukprot:6172905-Pleurochrysis_carterae.AAC.1
MSSSDASDNLDDLVRENLVSMLPHQSYPSVQTSLEASFLLSESESDSDGNADQHQQTQARTTPCDAGNLAPSDSDTCRPCAKSFAQQTEPMFEVPTSPGKDELERSFHMDLS